MQNLQQKYAKGKEKRKQRHVYVWTSTADGALVRTDETFCFTLTGC